MATIQLDATEQAFVDQQVESGAYASVEAMMHEGLALLRKRDDKMAWIRTKLQEGIDDIEAGRVHEYATSEDFLEDMRKMAAERLTRAGAGH